MRIGRLLIEKGVPSSFEYFKGSCECRFWSFPFVNLTWFNKECKCMACKLYICKCPDENY